MLLLSFWEQKLFNLLNFSKRMSMNISSLKIIYRLVLLKMVMMMKMMILTFSLRRSITRSIEKSVTQELKLELDLPSLTIKKKRLSRRKLLLRTKESLLSF